jgi:class 3 adenylate cyclase
MRGRTRFLADYFLIAFAAWTAIAWLALRPAPPMIEKNAADHFGVLSIPLKALQIAPQPQTLEVAFLVLVAAAVLIACMLAIVLLPRGDRVPAAGVLATSLASGAASVAYVFFVRPFPALGAGVLGPWMTAADFIASGLYAVSLLAAMRFFAGYPFRIDLAAFVREEMAGARFAGKEAGHTERMVTAMASAKGQASIVLGLAVAGAVSMRGGGFAHLVFTSVAMLLGLYVFWFGLACLRYKYKRALEEDRVRIQWLYFGAWTAGLVMLAWAFIALAMPLRGIDRYAAIAFATLTSFAPVIAGLIGLLSLAVSIFYRGAIDPRLAIRRSTIYTLLLALIGFVFIAIERTVVNFAAARLGLGPDLGIVVAAALAAAVLMPMRQIVERWGNRLVERLTPVATLGDGPRHNAAVAFSDLSGYTALTARDERTAMIAAALFHREAKRACERHGGRLVKTIGDAVHLEFPEPRGALAAVRELHRVYHDSAAALDLPPLGIHSGVHYGEVMAAADGDIYGTVVNLAARLQGQARDGEIVVSDEIRAACADATFNDLGAVALKNVPGKMQLYAVA